MDLVRARRERTRRLSRFGRQSSDIFPFAGGLNLIDSPLSVVPGQCQSALNYEMGFAGGYRRIGGYRSFDGSPSADNAVYDLLRYGATARPTLLLNTLITGDSSSSTGKLLTNTVEGGFGVNSAIHDEAYENAAWLKTNVTVSDSDLVWTGGATTALSKITESIDGSPVNHVIATSPGPMSVAVGDYVYASCFAKRTDSVDGFILQITSAANTFSGSIQPSATFNLRTGAVESSNSVVSAGIDVLADGVLRCWLLSLAVETAYATAGLQIIFGKESGGILALNYQGIGSHIHLVGCMGVILPVLGPHNLVGGVDFTGNWNTPSSRVTIADDDSVWTNGVYTAFTKLTDSTDAGQTSHAIRTGAGASDTPVDIRAGDKLYCEWYARATASQVLGHSLQPRDTLTPVWGGASFVASVNIDTLGIVEQGSAIESITVTQVETGVVKVAVTSIAAVVDGLISLQLFNMVNASGGLTAVYQGSGKFSHIIGFRCQSFPGAGAVVRMGYIKTTVASKNVDSGNLVLGSLSGGPFTDDEDLSVGSVVIAQAVGANTESGESDAALDAQYTALAVANATQALKPPGSGAVRGVWMHLGSVYAFRDNAGATQCDMWKSTGSGWAQITFQDVVHFDAGDGTEPIEGNTVTVTAGSKSAVIKRVVLTGGTWGVDAVGYLVLGTIANGPIADNDVLLVSAARIADAFGASAVPVLAPGGRYEFRSYNFYGHTNKFRMYGVDGKNFAFEYDSGEGVFTQIETGMVNDKPVHLANHNQHLFLGFPGGSTQLSGDGNPLSWTVITGASEIGVGDEITGYNEEVGNSLFIFTRNRSYILQGNTRANFDLDDFNVNAGAHEWSVQRIGLGTFFDDRGFTTLRQTQRSGSVNFQENTQSDLIQPLVDDLAKNQQVRCSHLLRSHNIYRCYFDDGRVVSIGFRQHKVSGHMQIQYPFIANVAASEEDLTGRERTFIGADDGFVYEVETGTSFNGDDLRAFMRTVLYHSKSSGRLKKYQQARLDATLSGALTLTGEIEYDFNDDSFNLADPLDFSTDEAGSYFDDFNWDSFVWDKPTSGIPQVKLEGEGVNMAVYLHTTSKTDKSHTLRGLQLQWLPRRDDRRN